MILLVRFDLSKASLIQFDEYEARMLARLGHYGGKLIERLRSIDAHWETHILEFPDADALEKFRADPVRASLQGLWQQCGAMAEMTEVLRLGGGS